MDDKQDAVPDSPKELRAYAEEMHRLCVISEKINAGVRLDDLLDHVFDSFHTIIPYDRIGLALLEDDGTILRSRWVRSDLPTDRLSSGYSALLKGSSLEKIIETGVPRIINDLEEYSRKHPESDSTKRALADGIRSSLTCPLLSLGRRVGVIFFSSSKTSTYEKNHSGVFLKIAMQLSVAVERILLTDRLKETKSFKDKLLVMSSLYLRNPLAVFMSYSDLFLDGDLKPGKEKLD